MEEKKEYIEIEPHEFIEINYTGFVEGNVFDTTKKIDSVNEKAKPLKICVGLGMLVKGLDKSLVGKKEKEFRIKLKPDEAFGRRDPKLVKIVSTSRFKDKSMIRRGALLNIDGILAKVISSTSGRVILDFNHPLAGKEVEYEVEILRKINDDKEKVGVVIERELKMYGINIKYNVKDKEGKINVYVEGNIPNEVSDKIKKTVKEIIGRDITIIRL